MTFLGQLATQKPNAFPFDVPFEAGLLGRKASQEPTKVAGAERFSGWIRMQAEDTPNVIANDESAEMAWLEQNAQELGQYKGEWLLIQGRQLLVHSGDFAAVRAAIQERQVRSPFVYYVPTDEESNSVTI